jgi:hypothetical protein
MRTIEISGFRFSAVLALTIVFLSPAVNAQGSFGAFRGAVKDSSGAVVPGATVAVRNQATAVEQSTTTDASGNYIISHLTPGTYTMAVAKAGFKSLSHPDLILNLDQQIELDLTLSVGATAESVTVTSSTPVLQTHSVDTGQVIETREILDLPLGDRNFLDLVFLTPGVLPGSGGNSNNISVNGQREFANSIVLNGIEVTGNRNNDAGITPSVDAMQEFKMVTSGYSAEFGRAAGGVVLLQTKSGTNQYHGDAYLFYRPKQAAATDYFSTTPDDLHHDNFGGTFGGPIIKDKTFFFVSYEANRLGSVDNYLSGVPPTNQIKFLPSGDVDLSGLLDPNTGNPIPIFDPEFYAQNFYSQQFAGNIIPAARVSPAGRAVLQDFFPLPSLTGTSFGWYSNSIYNSTYTDDGDSVDFRADHTISQKDHLFGEYHYASYHSTESDPFQGQIPVKGGGGTDVGDNTHQKNQAVSIGETHTFGNAMVNEVLFGFNNFALSQLSLLNGQDTANQYGVGNINLSAFPASEGFPYFYLGTGYTTGGSSYKPLTFLDRNYQLVDTVSISHGSHQLKFGGEFRSLSSHPFFSLFPTGYQYYAGAYSYASFTSDPTYTFYDPSAAFPTGGSDLADLLLGLPYTVNIGLQLTNPETKSWELHGFFQDEWKVSPRLAFFYGLRYEYRNPYYEAHDNSANYDPTTNTILLAGKGGNSSALVNADKTNFGPRVGFSVQVSPKTVLRAGYGIYYSPENDAREDVLTKNYPFNNQQLFFNDINAYYSTGFPSYELDTGVPRDTTIHIPSSGSSIAPSTIANSTGQSVFYVDPNFRTGYSELYNLTLQREILPNTSLEVAYVGSQGHMLPYAVGNINLNNAITPLLGHIQAQYPVGNSTYSSLQAKLNKRYSDHMSVLLSYTYGRSIDNGPAPFNLGRNNDSPQNPYDLAAERAVSDNDLTQNFTGSVIYELPFGRKQRFLGGASALEQAFLGGWQVNGITEVRSGLPYNIVLNGNNQNYPGLRPNLVGDPEIAHPTYGLAGQYFNPAAFAAPSCPPSNPNCPGDLGRNAYFGPGFFNIDASLFKTLQIKERASLQVRIEAYNVLNHPSFGNPNADFTDKQTFGKVTGTSSGAREMQFAVKLIF